MNSCISETKEWILPKYQRERMNQIPQSECVWPLVSVVMLYCPRPHSCHRSRGRNLPPACFCKRGDRNRNPHLLQSCKVFTIITAASRDLCWRWSDLWVSNPPRKEEVQLFLSWGSFGFLKWVFFFMFCYHEILLISAWTWSVIERRFFRNINHGALNGQMSLCFMISSVSCSFILKPTSFLSG